MLQVTLPEITKTQALLNCPWLDSPFFEELLAQSNLDEQTKQQIKQFSDNGYLIIDPEIDNFDVVAERLINDLKPHYLDPGRIQDAWKFNDDVKHIAVAPKVLSILRILYQREPIPFQTLNFPRGTEQSTHSDSIHFHCIPHGFMCGVWLALEDVDSENGPLHYYPGSHKLPYFDLSNLGISGSYQQHPYERYDVYEDLLKAVIAKYQLKKVDISIRKGQALIWAANLLHGGSPILDPNRTRHSQVTHYYFSDCLYYTPLLSDPFLKRIYMKKITNIMTGEIVPHYYNGKRIEVEAEDKIKIFTSEEELDKLRLELYQTKAELKKTNHVMRAMESSKFWQLRNRWFMLRKALGLVKGEQIYNPINNS
ncbi:MAG TPA: phytanoyl-CoA dioxygenase family protein [Leptolyngbyaceae cyanobacterium]